MKMNEVAKLVMLLTAARQSYYNDEPSLTDAEYDGYEDLLRELDPDNDFFKSIGAPVEKVSNWEKVRHGQPMMSLNKAQTFSEVEKWHQHNCRHSSLVLMEKLDGISISLYYENGHLLRAVTRGNGEVGEDITRNVLLMQGAPNRVRDNFSGYVRGEIVCKKSLHAKHFGGDSNPRNTASGTAKRQSDPEKCKYLTILSFECLPERDWTPTSKSHAMEYLQSMGFETPNWEALRVQEVQQSYDKYTGGFRDTLDYDIDGLVIAVDSNDAWNELGELNHKPRGSIAFKFPHDMKPTTLEDIVWQVGNTGRVTPIAVLAEVELAGANVKRASLHNVGNIRSIVKENLYFKRGDKVLVSRRNDVIPFVEKLIASSGGYSFETPTRCPECGSNLKRDGEYIVCPDDLDCPAQVSGAIKQWIKKLDVKDWGGSSIEALCESGLVNDPADLYTLSYEKLSNLQMSGRVVGRKAEVMLSNLQAKMELPLEIFVGSLNIPMNSRSMCKVIKEAGFDTLDKMGAARVSQLASINKMGDIKAEKFVEGFRVKLPLIERLLGVGVSVKEKAKTEGGIMNGKTVCMTGFRDAAMIDAIEAAGGTIKSSVVKGLDYLVVKDVTKNSGKMQKAAAQGTELIGIEGMWGLLGS